MSIEKENIMTISMADFIKRMKLFFPDIEDDIANSDFDSYDGLETILIEDIIMPKVIKLLKENDDRAKLEELFSYFENVVLNADEILLNIFSITVLEILGNEKIILDIAKNYMGPETTLKQREADESLGRAI